ncbi:MAG: twin-arginine translocase subunit TatC, partial [Rhodobacteraceae bacterium]|nr:twin-arginine translocase subunit TatC [Paracoccaceae bacterium]
LVTAVFVAMPYLLHQLWSFIAPGLYQHEKRLAVPLLASSVILFYAGAAFAYFVVFPLVFAFLTSVAPEGVAVATDITAYLDFVLTLFFAFGISFEVPIATILLVLAGMTTPDKLAQKRPFVVVGAFVTNASAGDRAWVVGVDFLGGARGECGPVHNHDGTANLHGWLSIIDHSSTSSASSCSTRRGRAGFGGITIAHVLSHHVALSSTCIGVGRGYHIFSVDGKL